MEDIVGIKCFWELFNDSKPYSYQQKKLNMELFFNKELSVKDVIKKITLNNEIVCFKIFPGHLSNTEICELCQLKGSYKLIGLFLTRNLKDSYISVNYSLLTDDWKSMPHRKNNINYINFKKLKFTII